MLSVIGRVQNRTEAGQAGEVREIAEQASSFEEGAAAVRARIPEGWQLLWLRVDRPEAADAAEG